MARIDTSTMATSVEIRDYYDKVALVKAIPLLLYRKFAQVRPMPQHQGEVIRFHRWGTLPLATTPLQEGITPEGGKIEKTELTAKLEQYGYWIPITDRVQLVAFDPILTEITEQLGEQQGETMDELMKNVLMGGSNVIYAGGVTSRAAVASKITAADLKKVTRALKQQNAKTLKKILKATTNVSTQGIRESYIAIIHVNTTQDLEDIDGFVPLEKYASQTGVMEGEVGSYKGIRFIETTRGANWADAGATGTSLMSTSGTNADVYGMLVIAENAYGEVPLHGGSSGIIIKIHGDGDRSDVSDPLNQRGSAAWKTMWTGKILNDNWLIRVEHGVSA